ncbi:uncharacterized protein ATNIH1004_007284 [Aspergillus tanneri]|uniref:Uncharacterized protein n=1 Tax=Aspergillus tanneri TaxID=1220188 RepID=A0A5M9MLM1_9EURO|nr:uncharacterized protein ATNIH1004_007284 [Aspergillus tanneri]KAA8645863.1 hypothetical protein ATNIH1004_007284 [Aspergillus tanneri]
MQTADRTSNDENPPEFDHTRFFVEGDIALTSVKPAPEMLMLGFLTIESQDETVILKST